MGDYATHLILKAERVAKLRAAVEDAFPAGTHVSLEFGCGHGHWLTAFAQAHPEQACLGLDLVTHRINKARSKRDKRGLTNLHFVKGEATELLADWPVDRPLREVFMLFPDPWPKARHHKHRMIQHPFLDTVATHLPPGARFHFRTDHTGYFDWTREHFECNPRWEIESTAPWPWETPTFFQNFMESWQSLIAVRNAAPASSPKPENEGRLEGEAREDHHTRQP